MLSRRLAGGWPAIWVNNAGLDGQSTYGHLVLLRDFVVSLRPTLAVFLVGVNDIGLEASNPYDTALVPDQTAWRTARVFLTSHLTTLQLLENLARMARARNAGFGHSQIDLTRLTLLEDDAAVDEATIRQYEPALRGI